MFCNAQILYKKKITKDIFSITLNTEIAKSAVAGQFINIYLEDGINLLPIPICISNSNMKDQIQLLIAIRGEGTKSIWNKKNTLKIFGPIGNGFNITDTEKPLLVGGGVGLAPLLFLVKSLNSLNKDVYLGFKEEPFYLKEFKNTGANILYSLEKPKKKYRATYTGNVMDIILKTKIKPDIIYACGPKPMLKALCEWAISKNIPIQISLEEKMACGLGVCKGCNIKILDKNGNVTNKKLCIDGPVFNGKEVAW